MSAVSNSTPLIGLSAIRSLDLLHSLFDPVIIPEAVYDEVVTNAKGRPGAQGVARAKWLRIERATDEAAVKRLMRHSKLHRGESEAIVLAQELKADHLVIDDWTARRVAENSGIRVVGTFGILLAAKLTGLIPEVAPLMRALLAAGIYIDPKTFRDVLLRAGEE